MCNVMPKRFQMRTKTMLARMCVLGFMWVMLSACGGDDHQEVVSVTFQGTVDGVEDPLDLLDGSVVIGSPISGLYHMKTSAQPAPGSPSHNSSYFDAIGIDDLEITVGHYIFKPGNTYSFAVQVGITNGGTNADGGYDGWNLWIPAPRVIGPTISADLAAFLTLYDPTENALSSTTLVPVPTLADWAQKRIGVARGSNLFIVGELQTITRMTEP